MTVAKELHSKKPAETKDLVVDCAGDLAAGETITAITGTTHVPAGLTITGVDVNDVAIADPVIDRFRSARPSAPSSAEASRAPPTW